MRQLRLGKSSCARKDNSLFSAGLCPGKVLQLDSLEKSQDKDQQTATPANHTMVSVLGLPHSQEPSNSPLS